MSFFVVFCAFNAQSATLTGSFTQGGLIYGETVPHATVFWQGEKGQPKVQADEAGRFVIGVHRLQKKESVLVVNLLDGIEEKQAVSIKQRDYKTQYIKGVKKNHVTPNKNNVVHVYGSITVK